MIEILSVTVNRQGLHDITSQVTQSVRLTGIGTGLCTLYIQHTSASLLIQENYDLSAKYDLEQWLNRLVPQHDALYTHTLEGPDDMPAHIKAALTATSLSIPVNQRELMLGTWQGVFLWEHRHLSQQRKVIVSVMSG